MRTFRKKMRYGIFLFLAALLIAQFIQVERVNPPARSDIHATPEISALLHNACYNCHSNETVWPWYSHVAPVSWLIASDVSEGRGHVNFSEWETYDSDKQSYKLKAIAEEIQGGMMPPWYYSMIHRSARLSAEKRAQILSWATKGHPAGKH
jgi:hypothetical protein